MSSGSKNSKQPPSDDLQDVSQYYEELKELEYKRRRESVHVLIALGIIGGYITFSAGTTELFATEWSQIATYILVGASGLFLFVKMTTVTIRPEFDNYWIELIDETFAPGLYALSVYGLTIVAGVNILSLRFPTLNEEVLAVIQGVLLVILMFLLLGWVSWKKTRTIVQAEEEMGVELANTLALLDNEGDMDSNHTDELAERFSRLITTRDDLGKIDYFSRLLDVKVSELNRSDRKRIMNLIERIKIKKGNGRPVSEDVDTLEEVLDEIEERG